jgi:hypothetical protein
MEDNTLRFSLDTLKSRLLLDPNSLVHRHFHELLDLLIPVQQGREIRVDGYKLLSDRGTVRPLYPGQDDGGQDTVDTLDLYEPRLSYIRSLLQSLLSVVELEMDGKPVGVDGFRLKKLEHWLAPCGGAGDILAHASANCNLNCRFCYNKAAPVTLSPRSMAPEDERREMRTRIDYYVPRGKLSLFPHMGSPAELLTHPDLMTILRRLREKTSEVLRIPTNGSCLNPAMIRCLSEFAPVYLDISLNSSAPERRSWLMNDPSSSTAINSLALLRESRIPFTVVIVPWPFPSREEMLDDLQRTVAFACGHDPVLIQISLPGCARALAEESPFNMEEVWGRLRKTCRELRSEIDCPLVIRPGLFEEYDVPESVNAPMVFGVVKHSPVANAGLVPGDVIVKINGLPIQSRAQARLLLTTLHGKESGPALLSVRRSGTLLNLELDRTNFDYPYTPETATYLGVVFASSGIPREWMERLKDVIDIHRARDVLLLTSRLVRPTVEQMVSHNGMFSAVNIHMHVPRNRFFGGNIFMGDLMVVEDFIEAVREFMDEQKMRPDLIVLPSSPFHLSGWGRDLTGRVYLDIERRLKIPVSLVECDPIFD